MVTLYICTGTSTSCTAGNAITTVSVSPSGGNWAINGVALQNNKIYTAQAYQTDASNNTGQSNVQNFST
jgi:hypothetical protein